MIDIEKLTRIERRKLLAENVSKADINLSKFKKLQHILIPFQDDMEVMELIRHHKHKDENLNDMYRESKKLLAEMAQQKYIIGLLMEKSDKHKPRNNNKVST